MDNPKKHLSLLNPVHILATGGGVGLLGPTPGTLGSIEGVCLGWIYLIIFNNQFSLCILSGILFLIGCYICQRTARDMKIHDHGSIIIDEIVAEFFIISFLPSIKLIWFFLAFVVFRFFDILKPYPIYIADKKIRNGFGIMADDILAAIYSIGTIYIIYYGMLYLIK